MKLGGADMVWIKDIPDDDDLAKEVKRYALILETHRKRGAGQEGNCLALIDPALYSLDYELTHLLPSPIESPAAALDVATLGDRPGSFEAWEKVVAKLNKDIETKDNLYMIHQSEGCNYTFCWLPTDIRVNADGSVDIKSYINNLHPTKSAAFYVTLSKVLANTIPLVEQVLTDLAHPIDLRVPIVDDDKCVVQFTAPYPDDDTWGRVDSEADDDEVWDAWEEGIVYTEPVPSPFAKPERPLLPYSLRGEELQVVVEMQNIHLMPDEPETTEIKWQNSGIPTDKIVATSIWYYDVENVVVSDIKFRDPVGTYEELDIFCSILEKKAFAYAYGHDGDCGEGYDYSQPSGSTEIKSGRVVCFPNSYQYCKPLVKLADASKPGHVKMLLFYFAHPGVRLPSTSIVAPQQQDWWAERAFAVPPFKNLPGELCHMIRQQVAMPMSLEKARERYHGPWLHSHRYDGECEIYDAYFHYGYILG
ncbi:hypothetical protein GGI22_005066 [Coemansia erecta]|nr:hypothetical protein GGI22_005066 [Coemansia erecta]